MDGGREIYVVSGMGRDVTGLVSLVTAIISDARANIIDLEENVFHGLFSIFFTVDLTGAATSGLQFIAKMQAVANQSGLQIIAEKQRLLPRPRERRLMRLLLLGKDRPGIVSCATFILANNGVNIEGAKMISRGELFAMEMELDWGASPCPGPLIERGVAAEMRKAGIRCFFQRDDFYRRRPRLLVLAPARNLLEEALRNELAAGAGKAAGGGKRNAAALAGMKVETIARITGGLRCNSEGDDLLHALKGMGWVVALLVNGLDLFLDPLRGHQCIDGVYSDRLLTDRGRLTGKVEQLARDDAGRRALVASIAREKGIAPADTVVVGPASPADIAVPELGVRVLLDKENFRSLVGKQVITAAQVPAILAAFGPR
jgi:predicted amino acid-binding ACT domain protein/phosphoserine phosphatase